MPLGSIAQSLEAVSGATEGKYGDTLTFVVEAQDSDGNPQSGVAVFFGLSPSDGTARLRPYNTATGDGWARTVLILNSDAGGTYRVSAWRGDDVGLTAIFAVTVDAAPPPPSTPTETPTETTEPPPEPTTLKKISGDNQEGVAGTMLADPFVVEVRDENDRPLEGATATFNVTEGMGAIGVVTSKTDVFGRVASTLTLGSMPGTNRVHVRVEGIFYIVIFRAEGTSPSPEPMPDEEEEITPPVPEPMPDDEEMMPPPEPKPSLEFNLVVPSGFSLIHVPLEVTTINGMPGTIKSVADLYDALGDALGDVDAIYYLITYDSETKQWPRYLKGSDRGSIVDTVLTEQTGIVAYTTTSVSLRLGGEALGVGGRSIITLNPGVNLVGLPLMDSRIANVSNLFTLEGVAGSVIAITVSDNGTFKTIDRAGADGDIPVTGGSAFLLINRGPARVPIFGTGWQK